MKKTSLLLPVLLLLVSCSSAEEKVRRSCALPEANQISWTDAMMRLALKKVENKQPSETVKDFCDAYLD